MSLGFEAQEEADTRFNSSSTRLGRGCRYLSFIVIVIFEKPIRYKTQLIQLQPHTNFILISSLSSRCIVHTSLLTCIYTCFESLSAYALESPQQITEGHVD